MILSVNRCRFQLFRVESLDFRNHFAPKLFFEAIEAFCLETKSPFLQDVRLTNFDKETTDIFLQEFQRVYVEEIPKLGFIFKREVAEAEDDKEEMKEDVLEIKAKIDEGNEMLDLNKFQSKETAGTEDQIMASLNSCMSVDEQH